MLWQVLAEAGGAPSPKRHGAGTPATRDTWPRVLGGRLDIRCKLGWCKVKSCPPQSAHVTVTKGPISMLPTRWVCVGGRPTGTPTVNGAGVSLFWRRRGLGTWDMHGHALLGQEGLRHGASACSCTGMHTVATSTPACWFLELPRTPACTADN